MQDLSHYLEPVNLDEVMRNNLDSKSIGQTVEFHTKDQLPPYGDYELAILGVKEDRGALSNEGSSIAPDVVRKYLYRLYAAHDTSKVIDLGDILRGNEPKDTHFALKTVLEALLKRKVLPIIIGGGQDLTHANYLAYGFFEQMINLVCVDASIDMENQRDGLHSKSFVSKIIMEEPSHLFNYSHLGYQTYLVNPQIIDAMDQLYFDAHRLGELRADIKEAEPIVRNADLLSFDISSIRQSEAPGNGNATPNGMYGEEACQICFYAGMSDKLTSIGFYETNPLLDSSGQTAHLVAQMIWHFLDGYFHRKKDFPLKNKHLYTKYLVNIKDEHELTFYKSKATDRWWLHVPYPASKKTKYDRHHLVPCSYADYQTACKEEMPDKWWRTFQKLN